MSQREIDDSRLKLHMPGNHAIANRREISLRDAVLPVFAACVPSCCFKPVALCGDLKQAFLQVRIQEADRDALRFHWIKDRSPHGLRFCNSPGRCLDSLKAKRL